MAFCSNCGAPVEGRYCPKCGTAVGVEAPPAGPGPPLSAPGLRENMAAALCYVPFFIAPIIFLVLEPYSRNKLIRFHAFQSIFLGVAVMIVWWALRIILPWGIWRLIELLDLAFFYTVDRHARTDLPEEEGGVAGHRRSGGEAGVGRGGELDSSYSEAGLASILPREDKVSKDDCFITRLRAALSKDGRQGCPNVAVDRQQLSHFNLAIHSHESVGDFSEYPCGPPAVAIDVRASQIA